MLRFLPRYSNDFCLPLHTLTPTYIITVSLIASLLFPSEYSLRPLYIIVLISHISSHLRVFTTYTMSLYISLPSAFLPSALLFFPFPLILGTVSTRAQVTVQRLYFGKGCFWRFRKTVLSLLRVHTCTYTTCHAAQRA